MGLIPVKTLNSLLFPNGVLSHPHLTPTPKPNSVNLKGLFLLSITYC